MEQGSRTPLNCANPIICWSSDTQVPALKSASTGSTVFMFTPSTTSRTNRDFNLVTTDGNIYCYQLTNYSGHVFTQLVSNTHVKMEVFSVGATCGDSTTWAFTSNAVTFAR